MRMLSGKMKLALVGLAAVAVLAASAGVALAVFPSDNVASYAGCLNTNASPGGTFVNIALGDTPAKPCGGGQMLVHLSGGDITSVNAASGLTGGGTNGAVTLSLAAGQSLPQTCSNTQVPKWNGSGWSCGTDNDTTYSNGTGLDVSGTTFSVVPSFRLPQSCGNGQIAKWNGSSWTCANEATGGHAYWYLNQGTVGIISDLEDYEVARKDVPSGTYAITARVSIRGDNQHRDRYVCSLRAGTAILDSVSDEVESFISSGGLGDDEGDTEDQVTLIAVVTVGSTTPLNVVCKTGDPGAEVRGRALMAVSLSGSS